MHKLKWGVLGYARIAKNSIIPAILKSKNSILYGVASRDHEKLKECSQRFRCEIYSCYEDLLDDPNIQAVYIPLPNGLHKEWVIKAANKGKHILCEKPLALNQNECIEMISECKKSNVKLMEAFMYRYSSRTQKVKAIIEQKRLGDIRHIYSAFYFTLDREDDYRWDVLQGGGALFDIGCYPINLLSMIIKEKPNNMIADCITKKGVDLRFDAVLKYNNNITAQISCGFDGFPIQIAQITGSEGTLLIPDTFLDNAGNIRLVTKNSKEEIWVDECDRYVLEVEDFANAVLYNREPMFSIDETVMNISIIEDLLDNTYRHIK